MCGFGEPHDAVHAQRLLMAQPQPILFRIRRADVRQIRFLPVADVKQISEHLDRTALLSFAEQRRQRHFQKLPQQIEQRALNRRDRVNGCSQIIRLNPAPARIAISEFFAHSIEHRIISADGFSDNERPRVLERLPDFFAARNFAKSGALRAVLQDDHIACEEWPVRATEVQQHAVMPSDGDDKHFSDGRRTHGVIWIKDCADARKPRRGRCDYRSTACGEVAAVDD